MVKLTALQITKPKTAAVNKDKKFGKNSVALLIEAFFFFFF